MIKIKKFDSKKYRGPRIYQSVSGRPGISKLWIWNKVNQEYDLPVRGKVYYASKKILSPAGRITKKQFFSEISEALNWQAKREENQFSTCLEEDHRSESFGEVLAIWQKRELPRFRAGTQIRYSDMIRKCFGFLNHFEMSKFDSKVVDCWIDYLMLLPKTKRRRAYKHELDLLSGVLKHFQERTDGFVFPIKKRHKDAVRIFEPAMKNKEMTPEEFFRFRNELKKLKDGEILAEMATVQYFQALRISEVAALTWGSIVLNFGDRHLSRLTVDKSVKWLRQGGYKPSIEKNFKNSGTNKGVKEQPIFPESFEALVGRYKTNSSEELVFANSEGSLFSYRTIQQRFGTAFQRAGLNYSSTHILRHGGCRYIYNKHPDLAVAQQLLGNSDLKSVLVYAQRNTGALNEVAKSEWAEKA